MIDLEALRSLRAVAEEGSVVAAAAALGYTPSAVSQQVKRLERDTGLPMLERVGRGVVLSRAGAQLVEDGTRLLTDLESLESDLHRQAEQAAGHLRLGTFSTATRGLVAPALAALATSEPLLRVTVTELEPWDAIAHVATGRQDAAVVHAWGDVALDVPEHLERTVVMRERADLVVRPDHPFAGRESVTARDLLGVTWVATPEGTICRQWLSRMYDGTGARPRVAHVAGEFDSHLALVAAGLGVSLVPRLGRSDLAAVPGGPLVAVPVVEPVPTRTVSFVSRRSMAGSPAVTALREALSRG
ncbi:LysR family transcriptional regulator [Nocardioides bruguierae]|uniref:LysR family transcriptional regulator n=1 Tax=Nocardioides bruguierae TaxID=2945102 RepID=A0A9X2IGT7_9ACTN|nr:LysR family transcriptional regulator [Nocardioides bruguierae]MCM0621909.1 LysR family transcriptional regulator [Nocardioides bruguierae]